MNSNEFFVIIAIIFILGCFAGFLIKDIASWVRKNYRKYLFRPKVLKPLTAQNRFDSARDSIQKQQPDSNKYQ